MQTSETQEGPAEILSFRQGILAEYLSEVPFPLAFERSWECRILGRMRFERPVLDVGCGEGLFAKMLFADPVDTGIDPNKSELARASDCKIHKELIRCMGDAIPKPDGHYRTIFSNSVLEHIPNVEPVLAEMHRLLAPGGRLYLTVPSDKFERYTVVSQVLDGLRLTGLASRYRRFFNSFWRHYHCYPRSDWEALTRRLGFSVVESFTYGPKHLCLLNDFLVPFCLPRMVLKRLTNRWTLVPGLRRAFFAPVAKALDRWATRGASAEDGGLVFLALSKDAAAQSTSPEAQRPPHRRSA